MSTRRMTYSLNEVEKDYNFEADELCKASACSYQRFHAAVEAKDSCVEEKRQCCLRESLDL